MDAEVQQVAHTVNVVRQCSESNGIDFWTAIAATTGIAALVVNAVQTAIARSHNFKSTQPLLAFTSHRESSIGKLSIYLSIENHGVGPAIIENVIFSKAGVSWSMNEAVGMTLQQVGLFMGLEGTHRFAFRSSFFKGFTHIKADGRKSIIELMFDDPDGSLALQPIENVLGTKCECIYQTIYGHRYSMAFDDDHPRRLRAPSFLTSLPLVGKWFN